MRFVVAFSYIVVVPFPWRSEWVQRPGAPQTAGSPSAPPHL